jgi:hypothetical protein
MKDVSSRIDESVLVGLLDRYSMTPCSHLMTAGRAVEGLFLPFSFIDDSIDVSLVILFEKHLETLFYSSF